MQMVFKRQNLKGQPEMNLFVGTMSESTPENLIGGDISDISSANSDIDPEGSSKIQMPNNRSLMLQKSNSAYKESGIMAITNALRSGDQGILKKSLFSQSKANLLDKPIQEEENQSQMGIKLENADDDTPPRIRLKMGSDNEEILLNPSENENDIDV